MRHNHNFPMHVAFVDIVKAFDTVKYDLLMNVLGSYGAPQKLRSYIAGMYADLKVVLKIGKLKTFIEKTVVVRKCDWIYLVLFLFLVVTFAETLEEKWTKEDPHMFTMYRLSNSPRDFGQIISYSSKILTKVLIYEIFCIIYVDYGAFTFEYR